MNFKNKVAIVTGAGQGIGFEICRMLAQKGAKVILNDIDPDLASKAEGLINESNNGRCRAMAGDSSELVFINKMVDEAISQYGQLDIVIANAGITLYGDFFTYTKEAFSKVMDVNLGGSFFLAQAAAKQMKQQGKGGSILFMSSVVGHQALKSLAAYAMTKAALEMLAKNLVIELSPYKINVNTVAPGATLTERTTEELDYERVWSDITPMGRPAYVTDIANTALFLISDQARHITGQSLIVDGGWTSLSALPDGLK
ncbi:SDR family NAD(P)-dependent oxidoreductase [Mucilaginibacter sp. FT3.2]|uniref:SDR family NAD(P)-dependent oxidoreductase n=1 Tax=Mucilaginibacter sp. FT3.2 TaxID=2723090 RepID=UPI001622A08A|nr:SDR family oxidoreductase [Mucilaginibacter sp. FT3.2]MBB6232379.1 NAD(P)-dependent dehydrogenase (short-subunit alcohol dehydrogenase family) [Mucilaginibacter sp. FT3.2]